MFFIAYTFIIESDFDLQLPQTEAKQPDIIIRQTDIIDKASLKKTKVYRKNIVAKAMADENRMVLEWEGVARFEASNGNELRYVRFTDDDNIFRLFLLSEAIGIPLLYRHILLLHGSAVMIANQANIFIGRAGAGKSTTVAAFAKAGFSVLNDDMTAILIDNEGIAWVLPAFSEIKIWQDTVENLGFDKTKLAPTFEGNNKFLLKQTEEHFPKRAICLQQINILQRRGKNNEVIKIFDVPIELVKYFPLPHQFLQGVFLQQHFANTIKIASKIPVKTLNRPKNYDALHEFVEKYR